MSRIITINSPKIVHDNIADEVLVIHSDTGAYHTMTGLAARIWNGLEGGMAESEVVDQITAQLGIDRDQAATDVADFLSRLSAQDLVIESKSETSGSVDCEKIRYDPPRIESYTDMQDLILVDPIHDVDAAGWPPSQDG